MLLELKCRFDAVFFHKRKLLKTPKMFRMSPKRAGKCLPQQNVRNMYQDHFSGYSRFFSDVMGRSYVGILLKHVTPIFGCCLAIHGNRFPAFLEGCYATETHST